MLLRNQDIKEMNLSIDNSLKWCQLGYVQPSEVFKEIFMPPRGQFYVERNKNEAQWSRVCFYFLVFLLSIADAGLTLQARFETKGNW